MTLPAYLLALDQGTTSSRAIVFREDGTVHSMAQQEFGQLYPQPGWVEHDPEEIWSSVLATCRSALRKAKAKPHVVKAIGITNQRETVVIWNRRTGKPIHKAIVWQDRRTADFCEALKTKGHEPLFSKKTGLLLDPYFSGTKLRWLLDNVPDARSRALAGELAFGTIDSWLVYRASGGACHVTDASNASRTLLFNLRTLQWDDAIGSLEPGKRADLILVDHEITPSQARILEKATGLEVMDRTMVILEIFRRHARSRAARAQVEIARLNYLAPRLRETGGGSERQVTKLGPGFRYAPYWSPDSKKIVFADQAMSRMSPRMVTKL